MRKRLRGFTLIELLIVVAIIGILSATALASFSLSRAKANDARRLADLKQVQTALELYYQDNGSYPVPVPGGWRGTTPGCYGNTGDPNEAAPGLTPKYIKALPQDPKPGPHANYCYIYISNGTDYKFMAYSTVQTKTLEPGEPYARYTAGCGGPSNTFAIYTPGYSCF